MLIKYLHLDVKSVSVVVLRIDVKPEPLGIMGTHQFILGINDFDISQPQVRQYPVKQLARQSRVKTGLIENEVVT